MYVFECGNPNIHAFFIYTKPLPLLFLVNYCHIDGEEKYSLEKYYAENIDGVYPEVYELLTDPNKTYITTKQRAQIVMTTMSLFFRTPKFLNFNERRTNLIIDYGVNIV